MSMFMLVYNFFFENTYISKKFTATRIKNWRFAALEFVMRKLESKPLRDAVSDTKKSMKETVKGQYKSTRVDASYFGG